MKLWKVSKLPAPGLVVLAATGLLGSGVRVPPAETLAIRGHLQTVHLYGSPSGDPVIVSSGDGGWVHLGPHVAEILAAKGFFVVGFDTKAYLESFTSGSTTLSLEE